MKLFKQSVSIVIGIDKAYCGSMGVLAIRKVPFHTVGTPTIRWTKLSLSLQGVTSDLPNKISCLLQYELMVPNVSAIFNVARYKRVKFFRLTF